MKGFYVTVSNGLLTKEHRKRMGAAVWEFMWLIDKITKIDEDGVGWVLGGKPLNLKDISEGYESKKGEVVEGIGAHETTVSRNLNKLEREGYVSLKHTPYGIVISVKKAQKRFSKNATKKKERFSKNAKANCKSAKPNIRQDSRQDSNTGEKKISHSQEFNFQKEYDKLRTSKRKVDNITHLYWNFKGYRFENREQYSAALGRDLKFAKELKGYNFKQLSALFAYCARDGTENGYEWKLSTAVKKASDFLNKPT